MVSATSSSVGFNESGEWTGDVCRSIVRYQSLVWTRRASKRFQPPQFRIWQGQRWMLQYTNTPIVWRTSGGLVHKVQYYRGSVQLKPNKQEYQFLHEQCKSNRLSNLTLQLCVGEDGPGDHSTRTNNIMGKTHPGDLKRKLSGHIRRADRKSNCVFVYTENLYVRIMY